MQELHDLDLLLRSRTPILIIEYIGEAEKNLRQALKTTEVMTPCVLWMDEIFFVDLPDPATRKTIFSIHLRRCNLAPSSFDLEQLAESSEGFTGAGIEQVVVSALYAARALDATLDGRHLLEELERTQPLSVVMAERIQYLRDWAHERMSAQSRQAEEDCGAIPLHTPVRIADLFAPCASFGLWFGAYEFLAKPTAPR